MKNFHKNQKLGKKYILQVIQKAYLVSFLSLFEISSSFFCSQLKKFLKKLRKECHWLHSMSYTLCARCTVCMGKATKPCARHEERSCRHHDCGHYIPLEGGILCCKPGQMLEKEPLKPWIRAIEHVSKVRHGCTTILTVWWLLFAKLYNATVTA